MNYTKQCWYCGKVTMVNRGDCFQCSECGATWNKIPSLGMYDGVVVASRTPNKGTMFRPQRRRGKVKGGLPLKPLLRPSNPKYNV